MPEKRTYCFSDSHIGYEHANLPKINKFLDEVQKHADMLILNGDIYDLTRCPFDEIISQEPTKETHELLMETLKVVPEFHYAVGNHDYEIGKYLNINCVNSYTHDNFFFFHGWQLDLEMWMGLPFFSWVITPRIYQMIVKPTYQIFNSEAPLDEYAKKIHDRAETFVDKTGIPMCIGHTHAPIIAENGKFMDSGDFIDSNSYIVIEDGHPRLYYI